MAKISMIERDKKRLHYYKKYKVKRSSLKKRIMNKNISVEERFNLQIELNSLPLDSSKSRQRKRCEITGRPRGFYRKFNMSRIALREFALLGMIPGLNKSSW